MMQDKKNIKKFRFKFPTGSCFTVLWSYETSGCYVRNTL